MGRIISITSGSGGVGKTALTANIGGALASLGQKVCLVDLNFGLRALDFALGLESRVIYNSLDVLEGRCTIKQALVRDKRVDELYLLPASITNENRAYEIIDRFPMIIDEIREEFDFIIIDTPTGINEAFYTSLEMADNQIVVATPSTSSIRTADKIIGIMEKKTESIPLLIINQYNPNMVVEEEYLEVEDIVNVLSISLLGIILEDEELMVALNRGDLVDTASKNYEPFHNIAKRLLGEEISLSKSLQARRFFFTRKPFFRYRPKLDEVVPIKISI